MDGLHINHTPILTSSNPGTMATSSAHTGGTHMVTGGTLASILKYPSKKASAHLEPFSSAAAADIISPNVITTGGEILQEMAIFREPAARAFAVLWLFALFYMSLALCFTLALHRDWTLADSPRSKDDDIHPPFSETSRDPRNTSSMSTGHRGHHRGVSHGAVSSLGAVQVRG